MLRLLLLLPLLLLAACSSTPIKLYAGPIQPDSAIATLRIPVQINILSVNGKPLSGASTFLGMNDRRLKLQPGRYRVLVYYKDIWQTSASDHETIESQPVAFDLTLVAGHTYQMDFKRAKNTREAEAFRTGFAPWVTDTTTGQRTDSHASGLVLDNSIFNQLTGKVSVVAAANQTDSNDNQDIAPLASTTAAATAPSVTVAPSAPVAVPVTPAQPAAASGYLDMLKAQWGQANPAEKRAFLQWITAHP